MKAGTMPGSDMRSIYIRSLLFAFGLAGLLALELLVPRGVDAAAPAPVGLGHAPA